MRRIAASFLTLACLILSALPLRADEGVQTPVYTSTPDDLIIYQANVAFAKDTMKIFAQSGVSIGLPQGVLPQTLYIVDGGAPVNRFRLSAGADEDGSGGSGRTLAKWTTGHEGERSVTLSYLMSGFSWSPTYSMTLLGDDTVHLRYGVLIRNDAGAVSQAHIRLVSGLVNPPGTSLDNMSMSQRAYTKSMPAAEGGLLPPSVAQLNAYYVYDVGNQRLEGKGLTAVNLLDKDLPAEKALIWYTPQGEQVNVIYTVTNTSDQPFAAGSVDVYQSGVYMGSDTVEWTPSGAKGHVSMGGSLNIQASKTIDITEDPQRRQNKEYHHTVELHLKNFGKEASTVKIIEPKYPDAVELKFSEKPGTSDKGIYTWKVPIQSGQSATITYSFWSDSEYRNPYQTY